MGKKPIWARNDNMVEMVRTGLKSEFQERKRKRKEGERV